MDVSARIHNELCEFTRKFGDKVRPWYIVLGKKEIEEIAKEWRNRARFGLDGENHKTPNRFYSAFGDHRIVAIPVDSHFSLGFDPDVANYWNQLTPFWQLTPPAERG